WTRQAGTHYLWQRSTSQPSDPAGGLVAVQVTVAAGVITQAEGVASRMPAPPSVLMPGIHSLAEYGVRCDNSTDNSLSLQRAFDTAPENTTLYIPQGGCRFNTLLTITRRV